MPDVDFRVVFARTPMPGAILTPELVVVEVNDAYVRASGRGPEELVGRRLRDAFPDNPSEQAGAGVAFIGASLERARDRRVPDVLPALRMDIQVPARGGGRMFAERWWRTINIPILGPDGETELLVHMAEDVTATHRAEQELVASERRLRGLVEYASDLLLIVGADGRITYANPAGARVLGRELEGLGWAAFVHPEDLPAAEELLDGGATTAELRVRTAAHAERWVEARASDHRADPAIGGVILTLRDVTERRAMERTLHEQALQDALTAVPNRRWFEGALRQAVGRAGRTGRPVGLIVLDVDRFKLVNDSLGHAAGDALLTELTRRITPVLRPGDSLARLGGDEFVVLVEDLHAEQDVVAVADRVRGAATGSYGLGAQQSVRVSVSAGVSTGTGDIEADALLAHADTALYAAKRAGRDRIEVFDPALRRELLYRVRLEDELHRALAGSELALHWQPIVAARGGAMLGAEALLRWDHPTRGFLRPADFLAIAEDAGLMPDIGRWVLDHAFAQAAVWQQLDPPLRVFVNLAAQQVTAPSLTEEVTAAAAAHGVDPGGVCLEVSERALDEDLPTMGERLHEIRSHGFTIALDDFGAGNTALTWLQRLPISLLKLDRSFAATSADPAAQAIVSAIVRLVPVLGIASLAEGVETPEQLETLTALGCDYVQGYHLARPQAAGALERGLVA